MPIIAKGSTYTPVPQGQYTAVCVDVVDLGMVTSEKYGKTQHKIAIRWMLDGENEDGTPIRRDDGKLPIISRRFTLSLDDRAALRSVLQAWRGKAFTPEEIKGFDVEKLIGVGALIQVVHTDNNGKTYDNVDTVAKLPKGMAPPEIGDYVRQKDRKDEAASKNGHAEERETEFGGEDADIPF